MHEHRINDDTGSYEVLHKGQWVDLFDGQEPTLQAAIEIILTQRDACRLAGHAALAAELDAKEAIEGTNRFRAMIYQQITDEELLHGVETAASAPETIAPTDDFPAAAELYALLRRLAVRLALQLAQARRERDAAVKLLDAYKKAAADALQLDMQAVVTGTDEWARRRQIREEREELARLRVECAALTQELSDTRKGEHDARVLLAAVMNASASWRRKYKAVMGLVSPRRLPKETPFDALGRMIKEYAEARKAFPFSGCIPPDVPMVELVNSVLEQSQTALSRASAYKERLEAILTSANAIVKAAEMTKMEGALDAC